MDHRAEFPQNASLAEVGGRNTELAREIMRKYEEVELIVNEMGRPDDGTDPAGFYDAQFFVPLKQTKDWPTATAQAGWRRLWFRRHSARSKQELIDEMNGELKRFLPGIDWNFSQNIRDNVMEALSGVKGEKFAKIFGPDFAELEKAVGDQVQDRAARDRRH